MSGLLRAFASGAMALLLEPLMTHASGRLRGPTAKAPWACKCQTHLDPYRNWNTSGLIGPRAMEPYEHKLLQFMQGCFGRGKRYANAVPELYRFTVFWKGGQHPCEFLRIFDRHHQQPCESIRFRSGVAVVFPHPTVVRVGPTPFESMCIRMVPAL